MLSWTILEELKNMTLWTTCICCISLYVFVVYWRGVASFSLLKALPIPGPRQWPYIGSLPDVIKYGGMHNMLWEYYQRYGRVYKMGFGRRPTIVVTDPEMIKQITIKEFPKFQNRSFTELKAPMNSFLLVAKDEKWKRIRTTLSPTFSAMKMKEVTPLMEEAADILAGKMPEAASSGENKPIAYMPSYVLHRDPALWPDPEKFDPNRFSPENRVTHDPYSYMPFGMGPRQCIGTRFALLEIKTAMLKILSKVKFQKAADTVSQLKFRSVLIMQPRDPIFLEIVATAEE